MNKHHYHGLPHPGDIRQLKKPPPEFCYCPSYCDCSIYEPQPIGPFAGSQCRNCFRPPTPGFYEQSSMTA